jgi:hypothetical protein
LLLPEPATASVALASLVGGSKRGQSKFDVKPVPDVVLSVFQQPSPNPVKKNEFFTVKFQAKEPGQNGVPVNGTAISVVAVNNNGTPTALFLDPPGSAPPFKCGEPGLPTCTVVTNTVNGVSGIAEFRLSSTKSGALKGLAAGDVVGRTGETVEGTATNKLNVKP